MGNRIVIHAGLPKCGSTALQFILASNRERLRADGIFYPISKKKRLGHMHLCGDFVEAHNDGHVSPMLERMVEEFGETDARTMLLSSEGFAVRSRWFSRTSVGDLLDDMERHVVVFLRRRDEWTRSFYKNKVKDPEGGTAGTMDEFVTTSGMATKRLQMGQIASAIERFVDVVQADRVDILMLDNQPQGTPALMGRVLGIPLGEYVGNGKLLSKSKEQQFENGKPINQALSDVEIVFLAACNRLGRGEEWNRRLRAALGETDIADVAPRLRILSPDLARKLLADGRADEVRLAERYGMPLYDFAPRTEPDAEYRQKLTGDEFAAIRDRVAATMGGEQGRDLRSVAPAEGSVL